MEDGAEQPAAETLPAPAAEDPVGARLIEEGRLTAADLARASRLCERTGQHPRTVLDRLGLVSLADWARTAAAAHELALVPPEEMPAPFPEDGKLSESFLRRHAIVPLALEETAARFAVADPGAKQAVSALRLVYGERLRLAVANERDIEAAFERHAQAIAAQQAEAGLETEPDTEDLVELANNAPTIRFVEGLFAEALAKRATDIHLEPLADGARVRLRVDGTLVQGPAPTRTIFRGVMSRLKILADLDIAERRLPQDGRITFRSEGRRVDIRMATAPTVFGEAITLRFLDTKAGHETLGDLAMPSAVEQVWRRAIGHPNGLILVTGPTGSGKTTTLHAALAELNDSGRKIVTIENPVEILTPGLVQIEVNPGLGWSFAAALRAILRHDPDVLMVGEIRDAETAEMAVRLALTGHLVLSTLHTNSAVEATPRLANLDVPRHLIESVLRMVASQRLVRRLCPACRRPANATEIARFKALMAPIGLDEELPGPDWRLMGADGCEACDGQGFRGRLAIFEALDGAAALRALDPDRPRRHATMAEHGLERVAAGETTLEELVRIVGPPELWR